MIYTAISNEVWNILYSISKLNNCFEILIDTPSENGPTSTRQSMLISGSLELSYISTEAPLLLSYFEHINNGPISTGLVKEPLKRS